MGAGTVYRCSDGRYVGDADLWERFGAGAWAPCCWDDETGEEWVTTSEEELLHLEPVAHGDLPDWLRVEHGGGGVRVIDRRPIVD